MHPKVVQQKAIVEALNQRLAELASSSPQGQPHMYYISGLHESGSFHIENGRSTLRDVVVAGGDPIGDGKDLTVVIVHRQPVDGATVEKLSFDQVVHEVQPLSPPVMPGDVIMVTSKPPSDEQLPVQGNRFRIRGEVPHAGDYPYTPGMSLLQALVLGGVNPPE